MSAVRKAAGGSGTNPKTRVALVDDLQLVIDGLGAQLQQDLYGFDVVIEARSWPELVTHPEYPAQVTVLDLILNDSISIGTKIQALLSAGSEVVVISRHSDPATVAKVIRAGALSYIPKTQGIAELALAIRCAARGEQYLADHFEKALSEVAHTPTPRLGRQEHRALALYASGAPMSEVAEQMSTTQETVKSYVKRARRKYLAVGVDLGTRANLRTHGMQEGWFDVD